MQAFIVVRHGCYVYGGGDLSPVGAKQMICVAEAVKEANIGRLPIILLCSTAPRAKQGGDILAKKLRIPEEQAIFDENLWQDNCHGGNGDKIEQLIDDNWRKDALILCVSHLKTVPFIARYVAVKFGHTAQRMGESDYGCGWLINSAGYSPFPRQ